VLELRNRGYTLVLLLFWIGLRNTLLEQVGCVYAVRSYRATSNNLKMVQDRAILTMVDQ